MQPKAIKKAKAEAKRFLEAVKAYETEHAKTYESGGYTWHQSAPMQSGAMRRASLDLTRALAAMRRP